MADKSISAELLAQATLVPQGTTVKNRKDFQCNAVLIIIFLNATRRFAPESEASAAPSLALGRKRSATSCFPKWPGHSRQVQHNQGEHLQKSWYRERLIPLTGTAAGTFSGVLNVTNFAVQNGQIVATVLLTGNITNLDGSITKVSQNITSLVTGAHASCSILSLTLGPLHLNVLGLVIDLNQVNLNITAQPGSGNLLGNLLCGVADLLNSGGALEAIVADLNSILKAL